MNQNINSVIDGCKRNYRKSQKELFFLLMPFAFRICCRYTSFNEKSEVPMYKAFIELFKNINHFKPGDDTIPGLKNWFKNILIEKCIEENVKFNEIEEKTYEHNGYAILNTELNLEQLSPQEIIEALRNLPSPYRTIFNLAVIDEYNLKDISSKLGIAGDIVESNLKRAREELRKLLLPNPHLKASVS